MSPRKKQDLPESGLAEVYGSRDLSEALPKSVFPLKEHDPRHAYATIRDELMLDGNARQNLATFCQMTCPFSLGHS